MLLLARGTEASSNSEAEHENHTASESTIHMHSVEISTQPLHRPICKGKTQFTWSRRPQSHEEHQVHTRNKKTKLDRAIHTAQPHSDWYSQADGHSATVIRCTWPSARISVQLTSQDILQLKMTNVFKSKLLENVKKQAERWQSQEMQGGVFPTSISAK